MVETSGDMLVDKTLLDSKKLTCDARIRPLNGQIVSVRQSYTWDTYHKNHKSSKGTAGLFGSGTNISIVAVSQTKPNTECP